MYQLPKPASRSAALERLWGVAGLLGGGMQTGLAERGLTLARAGLIWQLQRLGPLTQQALSRALRVTARNVTGLVDALEADGIVARKPHLDRTAVSTISASKLGMHMALTQDRRHFTVSTRRAGDAGRVGSISGRRRLELGRSSDLRTDEFAGGPTRPGRPGPAALRLYRAFPGLARPHSPGDQADLGVRRFHECIRASACERVPGVAAVSVMLLASSTNGFSRQRRAPK